VIKRIASKAIYINESTQIVGEDAVPAKDFFALHTAQIIEGEA
jgi:hypothetical protein